MAELRRVVIDVLKPHDPSLLDFAESLAELDCVSGTTGSLIELDQEVQNVKFTIEGEALSFETVEDAVEEFGGSVHSVDEVAFGEHVVEDRPTLQD